MTPWPPRWRDGRPPRPSIPPLAAGSCRKTPRWTAVVTKPLRLERLNGWDCAAPGVIAARQRYGAAIIGATNDQ
jgi:hypothetical protein